MKKVFDDPSVFDEDDMPCRCECGKWFDLNDGYSSIHGCNVICQECHDLEEYEDGMRQAQQQLDEIDDYKEEWDEEDDQGTI